MKFGSLFSGIGGFDLGFERAGLSCSWQCEIDRAASAVLSRRFPGVPNLGDVRNVTANNTEPVDLICGGFPCQDLSVAGKRAGLAGERSGLWFEFHRILAELRPQWVVIENVPGLLSSNGGRDFAVILRGLAELRYGVCWRVLDAQYFGVAQRRRRVFVVASLGNGRCAEVLFEHDGSAWDSAPSREAGEGITGTLDAKSTSANRGSQANEAEFCIPVAAHETGKGFWTEGLPGLRSQPGGTPENIVAYNIQQNDGGAHKRKDRPNGGMYVGETETALTVGTTDLTAIAYGGNRTSGPIDTATALNAHGGTGRHDFESETFIAWHGAQITSPQNQGGVFEDVTPTLNDDPRLSICWHNKQQSGDVRVQDDTAPTVSRQWGTGGNNVPFVGVRRLTPTECERLQGFPDGWTNLPQADSARYRQLGNAVCVNVAEWIGWRIAALRRDGGE